jgi:hypothetical protein
MEFDISNYLGQMFVGFVLTIFGIMVRNTGRNVVDQVDKLAKELHQHTLLVENRITRVETKLEDLEKKS